ncbi:MAG TPA: PIN domain-containing protein [Thermomicrobiales bacterium]|nr:PIN domain-containing protein [Thermomicrobiales bacterium]
MSRVDSSTLVFFDASCLIAAAVSSTGGSAFVWRLCERGLLSAAVSLAVLAEAESNLSAKFEPECLQRHRQQLRAGAPRVAPIPRLDVQPRLFPGINPKDEHVVAAAHAIRADILLTLDQPLAAEIERSGLGILARSPGECIRLDLPAHSLFASLREE